MVLSRLAVTLLLAPALAMLALIFVGPIAGFLWAVFAEAGAAAAWRDAVDLLGSTTMRGILLDTNVIALVVTVLVLVIGYPIAYGLTRAKGIAFAVLLSAIVLPYFTSVIVRTYSWMVLLGRNGLLNQLLVGSGLIERPLDLLYNRLGIVIGMTYVLLPYMVLTLFAAMRGIDPSLVRAAQGMGAGAVATFRRVFLPLTWHGVVAGCLMVFILSLGFFVTPALMGGPDDLMIAMAIEREIELTLNWSAAAVMSLTLLATTLVLFFVYSRFAALDRMLG